MIGSRYVAGGGTVDWGIVRRVISRGGSIFARTLLRLEPHDLTGGFKAWRAETLAAVPFDGIHAGGYVFQIEMTFRASRAGARVREVPIVFHDRRIGQSKMSRRILVEALFIVVGLLVGGAARPLPPPAGRRAIGGMSGQGRPLGQSAEPVEPISGMRVVLDARPLQEPDRAPATAAYLGGLLGAFDAEPLAGESFAFFLQSDLDDPTTGFDRLAVVGRRLLPPTRLLRSAAMTVDPFLLRGAALGAAWRAERGGAGGAVYHAAGGSTLPLASGLPVVVTLLDLAPWELAGAFQRTPATRFGQRIRGRLLRDADAVIVGSDAVGAAARRLLRIRRERIRVIPFAPREAFTLEGPDGSAERERLGLPERYLVYAGPVRRPPGPRHPPARTGRAGRRRPAAITPRGGSVAAAHPARRRES